ncbi:MAG: MJ1477/TM1410 family putative glycoside hydrolase [Amaricoccus sp.]
MSLPFLYQLQNASFGSLSATDFDFGVVDMDDAGLTASQVAALEKQGKGLVSYVSIGEAEDYRGYWQSSWNSKKPAFLLGENPDWPGNYSVKFWDPNWQKLMFDRVDQALKLGYQGVYLDIVDAYQVAQVQKAYPGTDAELRQEMIDFVTALSAHVKAEKPGFMVIPQNAVGLLAASEDDASVPNAAYLRAIDGLGVEDLWYDGNNAADWTQDDLQFIRLAEDAGKFVLATSYPTDDAKQDAFVSGAIRAGLVPFVADRDLTGKIDPVDRTIVARMVGHDIALPESAGAGSGGNGSLTLRIAENHTAVIGATSASLPDEITGGTDAALFALDAKGLHFKAAPDFEAPKDAGHDNGYDLVAERAGKAVTIHVSVTDVRGISVDASDAANVIDGTAEADTIIGRGGNDTIRGLGGDDVLRGVRGNDAIDAGAGDDSVRGGRGNDTITGGAGDDWLSGRRDDDRIDGGDGRDTLLGGGGNDRLAGGAGSDHLTGGGGSDTFVFAPDTGHDAIEDFRKGQDHIDLRGIDALRFASLDSDHDGVLGDADAHVAVGGGTTIIDLGAAAGDAAAATVEVGVTGLAASDFLFDA